MQAARRLELDGDQPPDCFSLDERDCEQAFVCASQAEVSLIWSLVYAFALLVHVAHDVGLPDRVHSGQDPVLLPQLSDLLHFSRFALLEGAKQWHTLSLRLASEAAHVLTAVLFAPLLSHVVKFSFIHLLLIIKLSSAHMSTVALTALLRQRLLAREVQIEVVLVHLLRADRLEEARLSGRVVIVIQHGVCSQALGKLDLRLVNWPEMFLAAKEGGILQQY